MLDPVTAAYVCYAQERAAKIADFSMLCRDHGSIHVARILQERAAFWHAESCKRARELTHQFT